MEWEHTSTDLPQVSHSNLEDQIMGEAQKNKIHFRVPERKFWECASKTMEDMEEWKKRFAERDIRDHHEILTDTNYTLTSFFNQENLAHFVLRYLKIRLSHDINEVYLNFNLKLSLKEDFSMTQMSHVLKFLDQETWKQIELGYLKFWINSLNN
ncbi:hypothetical protein PGTUg99_036963 [Puccinia graminis f. sp. tritici]|uniref:Uncharacterized protein n=1 Tax=Puccinia graminis f. sp. tritici TaxID=56615 RepID=A0A5B0LWD0_PUCGR|nr:hypothetical protein PGTUg99_036963 [Puccinia graminis f. sp. tritici]